MTKEITHKECMEYLKRIGPKDAATIIQGMRESMSEAAEKFMNTITQVQNTYPELFAITGMNVNLTVSDKVAGQYITLKLAVNEEVTE